MISVERTFFFFFLGIVVIHHEMPEVGVVNRVRMRNVHNLVKLPPPLSSRTCIRPCSLLLSLLVYYLVLPWSPTQYFLRARSIIATTCLCCLKAYFYCGYCIAIYNSSTLYGW